MFWFSRINYFTLAKVRELDRWSQFLNPIIAYFGKDADDKPVSSLQTAPHSVGTTHIQKYPMLPLFNSLVSIMDLPLLRGSISVRRRGVN